MWISMANCLRRWRFGDFKLDDLPFDGFSEVDQLGLESPFTKEEVVVAVIRCQPPGLNNFSVVFFNHCLSVVLGRCFGILL